MRKAELNCCLLPLKLKSLSVAILMALGTSSAEAVTLSFGNSTTAGQQGVDFNYATCSQDFLASREFRLCEPNNTNLGGGIPFQKDTINGTELWDFDAVTGLMTSVTNTSITEGLSTTIKAYTMSGVLPPSGAPDGGPGIDQGAIFIGFPVGFLAPFVDSEAGDFFGAGQYMATGADSFELFFPVLEAQWVGVYFPLGIDGNKGVTFFGSYTPTNTPDDGNGSFSMWAEHTITPLEDLATEGSFIGWTPQWYYVGTIAGFAPPSANPPSSDVGIFNGGRISLAKAQAIGGVDTAMTEACVGGCFDYSVTNLAAGATVRVTLPLTDEIPVRAVYRKSDGTVWRNFIVDADNFIESGKTRTQPVDCSDVTWIPGLIPGHHNCVRLTVKEGGVNDMDGVADGVLTDLGGVAQVPPRLFGQ